MNRRIHARYVLLDWDGTLLNSYRADTRAYVAMFRALQIEWDIKELEKHYSPNWLEVYRAAKVPRSKWAEADRLWRAAYVAETPSLLPGVRSALRLLKSKHVLGVVTGGSRWRVKKQIREFGFSHHSSVCVYSEDCRKKKPHPAPLQLALQRLAAKPAECVYVGDSAEDIEMARRAGVRTIGVLGPFPTAPRMRAAKPDLLLDSIRDVPKFLFPPDAR